MSVIVITRISCDTRGCCEEEDFIDADMVEAKELLVACDWSIVGQRSHCPKHKGSEQ